MLGQYLDKIGVPRLTNDLGDTCFRKVRYFMTNLEVWTITVILVEQMAEIYYDILARRSGCPVLKEICQKILADEVWHILFQCERLALMWRERSAWQRFFTKVMIVLGNVIVIGAVWFFHAPVFKSDQFTLSTFAHKSFKKLKHAFRLVDKALVSYNKMTKDLIMV